MLILFIANQFTALSQDFSSKKSKALLYKLTLSAGIGEGYRSYQTDVGIGTGIEMGVEYKKWSAVLSRKKISEFEIISRTTGKNYVSNFDLLFGKSANVRSLFFNLSTGLSLLNFYERDLLIREYSEGEGLFNLYHEYSLLKSKTLGLPLSLKVIVVPDKIIGFGLEFYANHNRKATFYGVNICIQAGKLRQRKKIRLSLCNYYF